MRKRLCALAAAALLLLGSAQASLSSCSPWAKEELETAAASGLIPTALESADLAQPITRAEFAAVAVRLYEVMGGSSEVETADAFSDTADPDVLAACALGLTNGVGDGKFLPTVPVARQDAATMFTRVYKKLHWPAWTLPSDANYLLELGGVVFFADHERIDDWARDAVYFMSSKGILKGSPTREFMPHNNDGAAPSGTGTATRQEAIIMALRIYQTLTP